MNTGATGDDSFTGLLDRGVPGCVGGTALRRSPTDSVGDHPLDLWMMIDRITFVTGAEIKDASAATAPCAAAAEDFTALEPGNENEIVGCGDAERFAIHFALFEFDAVVDAIGDGMTGVDDPDSLPFTGFAPAKGATGSKHPLE